MIELISIHIPKTAGTSFHQVLVEQYGPAVSPALRRRDVLEHLALHGDLSRGQPEDRRILHGHFTYQEVAALHRSSGARVICWLRHPAARVISNWRFFQDRLDHPAINPEVAALNAHRRGEDLLTYAALEENRNRMSQFLRGVPLQDLFFAGIQEYFAQELQRLAALLDWPAMSIPHLNPGREAPVTDPDTWRALCQFNTEDMDLYREALHLRDFSLQNISLP